MPTRNFYVPKTLKYTTILVVIIKQDSTNWEKAGLNGSPEGLNGIVPKAWPEKIGRSLKIMPRVGASTVSGNLRRLPGRFESWIRTPLFSGLRPVCRQGRERPS